MKQTVMNDRLCSRNFGPLWDLNRTWNTVAPTVSPCFQNTLLVWVPTIIAFLLILCDFRSSSKHGTHSAIINRTAGFRLVFLCTSLVLYLSHSVYQVSQVHNFGLLLSSNACYIFVLATLLLVNYVHMQKGIRCSGQLWLAVLTVTVSSCLKTVAIFVSSGENEDVEPFEVQSVFCVLESCSLFLTLVSVSFGLTISGQISVHNPWPEYFASFPSKLTFFWLTSFMWSGYKRGLVFADIYTISFTRLASSRTYAKLRKALKSTGRGKQKTVSLTLSLLKSFGWLLALSGLFHFIGDVLIFSDPFILKLLINYTTDTSEPAWHGFVYVFMIFLAKLVESLFANQSSYFSAAKVGLRIRSAITAAVYRKALKLSPEARQERTVGEIVNLMSVDGYRVSCVFNSTIHTLWSAPLQLCFALAFLYNVLGVSAFAGFGVFLIMGPLNALVSHYYNKFDERQMEQKDHRIKFFTEILNGIKIIKLYAWEPAFEKQITAVRNRELGFLKKNLALGGAMEMIWGSAELLASVATFTTYVLLGNALTPAIAFVALTLFSKLLYPLNMLPMVVSDIIQLRVSIKRLEKFLSAPELHPDKQIKDRVSRGNAIEIVNANISWGEDLDPTLHNITLLCTEKSLVGVVGRVGCGKSSLISAICGDLQVQSGTVHVKGSLGYVSQQAWIQNMSMRDNILFDKPYDEERYQKVLEACSLKQDLTMFVNGDMTEIGERGINLSGGQKQRVSLARAVYQDADIYLLDDPLSAVDVHVAKHIFEHIIGPNGLLKDKTRLLVTHSLTYLSACDQIVAMQDGGIFEQGTYEQLMNDQGVFCKLIQEFLQEAPDDEIEEMDPILISQLSSSPLKDTLKSRLSHPTCSHDGPASYQDSVLHRLASSETDGLLPAPITRTPRTSHHSDDCTILEQPHKDLEYSDDMGRLVDDETVGEGKVSWSVYWSYMKSAGWGLLLYIVFLALADSCYLGSTFWLQTWSDSVLTKDPIPTSEALYVYASFSVGQNIFTLLLVIAFWFGQMRAAKLVHADMLTAVMKAPIAFFETNPSGRITNRFSKDINAVDNEIAGAFDQVIHQFYYVLESILLIIYVIPWFAAGLVPLTIFYLTLLKFYVSTSRQLRRLESVYRSPIFSHFQETLQGVSVIRAFKQTQRFCDRSDTLVDKRNAVQLCNLAANRWVAILLDLLGNLIVCSAALLVVYERKYGITAGMVGLSISYAMNVMDGLSWGVRMAARLETEIVAMERIEEFKNTNSEAAWREEESPVSDSWPQQGAISFCKYSTRYRPGLDLVLDNINFNIAPSEKIGVVGRTGAGKSSLTLALFRLIEPAEGSIFVDGISLADCGLHDIRSKLTIIPQDPVLFSGTLRFNLDPFDQHTDQQLWHALKVAHLKHYVTQQPFKLMHPVSEGGSNISVGQRQLLCLARAVLRSSRVVVLDEATAAVDAETDSLVQSTIRTHFKHSTLITIAHRINTVLDNDRILVLDAGKVAEFGKPDELLTNKDSAFYKMVKETGILKLN